MKNVHWQGLALLGGLLVAVSVAVPGGNGGGGAPQSAPVPLGASLEVHVDARGEVEALLEVEPGVNVADVVFFSPDGDVRFAADVWNEDLLWSAVGTATLPDGCFSVSAELQLTPVGVRGQDAPAPMRAGKHAKARHAKPGKDKPGKGKPKKAKRKKAKRKKGKGVLGAPASAGPVAVTLTASACLPEPECPVCEETACPVCEEDDSIPR